MIIAHFGSPRLSHTRSPSRKSYGAASGSMDVVRPRLLIAVPSLNQIRFLLYLCALYGLGLFMVSFFPTKPIVPRVYDDELAKGPPASFDRLVRSPPRAAACVLLPTHPRDVLLCFQSYGPLNGDAQFTTLAGDQTLISTGAPRHRLAQGGLPHRRAEDELHALAYPAGSYFHACLRVAGFVAHC